MPLLTGSRRNIEARSPGFVNDLLRALGEGYNLRALDFSELNLRESVLAVRHTDVVVGVHGAGLVWSMFMEPKQSGLIEIFGDDRIHVRTSWSHRRCALPSCCSRLKGRAWRGVVV